MKIEQFDESARVSAGPVKAEVASVEDVVNQFGESILFTFNVTDVDGNKMEGMRIYCATPSLVPLSKLGKLVRSLVPKVTQKSIDGIKDTETLAKVAIGRTTKPNDINKLVVTGTSPADAYDSQLYLEGSETSGAVDTG